MRLEVLANIEMTTFVLVMEFIDTATANGNKRGFPIEQKTCRSIYIPLGPTRVAGVSWCSDDRGYATMVI